ncbi:MAG TPA: stalk domain-containing protein [Symbiobacteriaceae bacterium]|nr:stalk domain-containing protein [Symbiobacteriaceae bacterium]
MPVRIRHPWIQCAVAVLIAVSGVLRATSAAQAAPATTIALTINQRQAVVNGDTVTLDTAPILDESAGRTFVPVRFIGETLGAYIGWNGDEQKVTYIAGDTRIDLWIGRRTAQVNGQEVTLDVAPFVDENSRTLVPVRFVSEQMGAAVGWDGPTQTVTVTAPWVGRLVVMHNRAFSPATLQIAAGTRVTWVNLDRSTHDVFGPDFESPGLGREQAYSHTFMQAGTFTYACSYHEDMAATIVVD